MLRFVAAASVSPETATPAKPARPPSDADKRRRGGVLRFVAAASVAALVAISPAAAISGSALPARSLPVTHLVIGKTATLKDKSKTCQAGKSSATKTPLLGSRRRTATVACEQPPKSNLVLPSIGKSAAAAESALG